MYTRQLVLILACLVPLPACGGGSSPANTTPTPINLALNTQPGWDGFVADAGGLSLSDDSLVVGDFYVPGTLAPPVPAQQFVFRAVLGFDLSEVPAGATVISAELVLYENALDGTPLTPFVVEHIELTAPPTDAAYSAPTVSPDASLLVPSPTIASRHTADVTAAVNADVQAGRAYAALRISNPGTDGDAESDAKGFRSAENATTEQRPVLNIVYTLP